MAGAAPCCRLRELHHVGEGVLRRVGQGYGGDAEALGVPLEITAEVAEDDQGRHFRLHFYWRGLPVDARGDELA